MDKDKKRFLEDHASKCFVGLENMIYDGWELRFTQGFTGRANSVQIKKDSTIDITQKIEFCEKAYAEHDLPCIFKLSDADGDFIEILKGRGYAVTKPTDVMLLPLDDIDSNLMPDNAAFSSAPEGWFDSYFEFEDMNDPKSQDLTRKIHTKVSVDQIYIILCHDGQTAAVASLGVADGYCLLHNVVVSPSLRGKGLGQKLCEAAIAKAKEIGASHIYLQVMQNNPIALNLYKKLGFEKLYTYYYLKK